MADMSATKAREVVLAARPQGRPTLTDFLLEETAIPMPDPGQVLLRVQYLSLDPSMRGRMDDCESYQPPTYTFADSDFVYGNGAARSTEARAGGFS